MSRNYLDFTVNKKNPFMRDVFIDEIYNYAKKISSLHGSQKKWDFQQTKF